MIDRQNEGRLITYTPPKRRKLTKTERQQVYEKCNGHCAYCGCQLDFSKMQVDHVIPMEYYDVCQHHHFDVDSMDNYLPACRSCNNYKHSLSLDKFRQAVERWPAVLMRDNVTYRNAVRFGLVVPRPSNVVFYFEKIGVNVPSLGWNEQKTKYAPRTKSKRREDPCLDCDCYDLDLGCTMESVDRIYACPETGGEEAEESEAQNG